MVLNILLVYKIFKEIGKANSGYLLSRVIAIVVGLEIATGASMAYFSIPPVFQPIHLVMGTLLFGLSFLLFLQISSFQLEPKHSDA